MRLGIVISSDDPETAWNAFRLGNFALKSGDQAEIFLLGKGVECESADTQQFKVTDQMRAFAGQGGRILACGTCLKIRHSGGSELCPLSSLEDLYALVRQSDRIVSF
jgi:uncharacterized protein involved in oxidation of intracellular sulfur